MPRRVQDIVPNTHRSIRDIPVVRSTLTAPIQPPKKKVGRSVSINKLDIVQPRNGKGDDGDNKGSESKSFEGSKSDSIRNKFAGKSSKVGAKKWIFLLMGIVIIVAIAGYIASVYFSKAVFTIAPKTIPFSVDSTYVAQNTGGKGVLTYELATIKGDASATVPASPGPKISTSAKGKITVYNSFSTQSQRLIAGTRFADDTGRIYRLASSIIVPGYTTAGTTVKPGSIVTSVTAAEPGQSYNITKSDPISDFKIVAYKGTSKYESIYGRIATDISGGFVGTKNNVNPKVLASTTAELQSKITNSLLGQLRASIPAGYVIYPKAYVATFDAPTVGEGDSKSASIGLKGTVYGILFKRSELVSRVAGEQAVTEFDDFDYETPGLESLDFSIANPKDFSPEKKNTLIVKLKGEAMLVGVVPVDSLKNKLAGLSLAETSSVLRSFKPVIEIEKSSGSITPPWSKVPSDQDRITIEVLTK